MNNINIELVRVIKERIPKDVNAVDFIIDLLPMSKEAVYRRLRGEISFSLNETTSICNHLGISMDHLLEVKRPDNYVFHVAAMLSTNPLEEYQKMMMRTINKFEILRSKPESHLYSTQNTLTNCFAFKYNMISKMKLFKWIYNTNINLPSKRLADIIISDEIAKIQKDFMDNWQGICSSIILNDSTFKYFANDIRLFANLEIITEEEVLQLKQESLALIDDIEQATANGIYPSGQKLNIYVSHTYFDAAYLYAFSNDFEFCSINYGLNHLDCENEKICKYQRSWIESLMRYSTLISGSGELTRIQFFKKQKDVINAL